ncbi:MAG: MFS transporter [Chloroflexi bacterium]|jgi:GPH family glycoside/pentoside/hexuronide:cation symporter|nr:MFS transporter [Chloroflexota bacterium]
MPASDERLSLRTKVLYGLGDTGFSLTSTLIGVFFLLFLTDVVGLRPALAGLAIFVAKQWDWINDPLVGYISDRTRSRWGRRRPFLLFGAIPFAVVFALMWWRPPIASQSGLAVYYGGVYVLYDTIATFVYMPYFALTPELTLDYDERTALTTYRMAFSIIGSLITFIVPWMIIGSFRPENSSRVLLNGILFAVLSALPLLGTFAGTRERPDLAAASQPGLRNSLRAALGNRPFRMVAALYLLTWLTVSVVQAVLLYFLKYWLGMEGQSDTIFAVIFVTALVVLPFWQWASRRTEKRQAYMYGIGFWAAVQILLGLVRPGAPVGLILGLGALAGIGVSAAHVLPWSMIPDTIEWGQAETGSRHEGMFYSLVMLAEKAAAGLALFLVGVALDWAGYVPNATQQAPSALTAIRALTGPLPALLLCGGILLAVRFPLGRAQHLALRERLALAAQDATDYPGSE